MQVTLLICYPLLAHLASLKHSSFFAAAALCCLTIGILYKPLLQGRKIPLALLVFSIVAITLALYLDCSIALLKAPPIVFPVLLFCVFTYSLLPGNEPIVTAIGEAARGPLGDAMRSYTRGVTQMWAGVFCCLLVVAIGTLIRGDLRLWSLINNVVIYPFMALLFVGEFWWRKYRFPAHDHPSFVEYISIVVSANIGRLRSSEK